MVESSRYVLDREFEAPRELVWRCWTEPDLLARWYGPNVETLTHAFDLAPGGCWRLEMRMGDRSMFQRAQFVEVDPPARLVWLHATTDETWSVIANPRMPNWPRELLTVVTFEEGAGRTHMRLVWEPHEATPAELDCFASAIAGMGGGWEMGMRLLEGLLRELLQPAG
jgi:uncharacterized protein YndB with AHSA1/START domain